MSTSSTPSEASSTSKVIKKMQLQLDPYFQDGQDS
jgi:hypothetical protein